MKSRRLSKPSISRLSEDFPTNSLGEVAVDWSEVAKADAVALGNGGGLAFLYGELPRSTPDAQAIPEPAKSEIEYAVPVDLISGIEEMVTQAIQDAISKHQTKLRLGPLPPVWSENQEIGGEFKREMHRYWCSVEGKAAEDIAYDFKKMGWTQGQVKGFVHVMHRVSSRSNLSGIVKAIETVLA